MGGVHQGLAWDLRGGRSIQECDPHFNCLVHGFTQIGNAGKMVGVVVDREAPMSWLSGIPR